MDQFIRSDKPISASSLSVRVEAALASEQTGADTYKVLRELLNELTQTQAQLRDDHQRLRLATETAGIGLWEWNVKTGVLCWDVQMFRLYGIAPTPDGRLEYSDWSAAVLPEELAAQESLMEETIQRRGQGRREFQIRRRNDGQVRTIQSVETVRLDANGCAEWVVGTSQDVTHAKQASSQLQLFRAMLDKSNDGIEIVDPITMQLVDVNDTSCLLLGYTREELLGMTVFDIDPDLKPAQVEWLRKRMTRSGPVVFQRWHRRKDGSLFPVEISLVLVDVGRTLSINIVRDITERKKAEKSLLHANRALRVLGAGNSTMMHAMHEKGLLTDMCRSIVSKGGYRLAWIGYREEGALPSLRPVAHAAYKKGRFEEFEATWQTGAWPQHPACRTLERGVRLVIQDLAQDANQAWREPVLQQELVACMTLPLREKGRELLGVLVIYTAEKGGFDPTEVKLLAEMADELTFGIRTLRMREERDRFQQEHLHSAEQIRAVLLSTIRAMARTVEKRDPYTAGHQNRVAELATAIAREYGLDEERIEGLRLGALIHDVGKIYVPAEILNRPGRLSEIEFEMIKMHPQVGYDIVKDVAFPWPVADMVLQHHERMDGSGYPQGLAGDAILLEARILAVADVVEAITNHRPYRSAHGLEIALAEVQAQSGRYYDVQVVDACLRLFREKHFTLERLADESGY